MTFFSKSVPSFQSATLVAVPESELPGPLSPEAKPFLFCILQTRFGNIGCIAAPIKDVDLFKNKAQTTAALFAATEFAARNGASTVSYTGLLPSSTNGLLEIQKAIETSGLNKEFPQLRITTGHETVVSAFVLNIERICSSTKRDFNQEQVTFVGLGHIGEATLHLLFRLGYRPRSITLLDISSKLGFLQETARKLKEEYGYEGELEVITVPKSSSMPEYLYNKTTFILGASSTANIVDIDKLNPGTIIVDDSFPLCFDPDKGVKRIEKQKDILISIAGGLASEYTINCLTEFSSSRSEFSKVISAICAETHSLTGCVYSSVLINRFNLPVGLGKVNLDYALSHYTCYKANGFHGTRFYMFDFREKGTGSYVIPSEVIEHFSEYYSHEIAPLRARL